MQINNYISLMGNLTKDPEYKTTKNDKELAVIRVAVNQRLSKENEETLYIDINAWGWHVPYCKNVSLSKGDKIMVTGRLQDRSWVDSDEKKRFNVVVVPTSFTKCVTDKPAKATETVTETVSETAEVF